MKAYHPRAPRRRPLWQRILRVFLILILVVALVAVVAFAAFRFFAPAPEVHSQVTFQVEPKTPEGVSPSVDGSFTTSEHVVLNRKEGVYTCLIVGSDDGNGNSDTIILGVFDTKKKSCSMVSIPRDTMVEVNGTYVKINSTYGMGGVELVRDTVSNLLAVPIDFHVSVDLDAFSAIVEEIGGVWFDVPVDMDYEDYTQNLYIHLKKGYQKLDATQAIGVVRCRNAYATADIGRTSTQRDFLVALVSQTITPANATKIPALVSTLSKYVETDMPLENMLYFATQAVGMNLDSALKTSETLTGEWISPFYELDKEKALEVVNALGIYKEEVPASVLHIESSK